MMMGTQYADHTTPDDSHLANLDSTICLHLSTLK